MSHFLFLPADYDLYIYNKNLKLIASSVNQGAYEVVFYNSNARKATYYIKAMGKSGAYNTGCYTLVAQALSAGRRSASSAAEPFN